MYDNVDRKTINVESFVIGSMYKCLLRRCLAPGSPCLLVELQRLMPHRKRKLPFLCECVAIIESRTETIIVDDAQLL